MPKLLDPDVSDVIDSPQFCKSLTPTEQKKKLNAEIEDLQGQLQKFTKNLVQLSMPQGIIPQSKKGLAAEIAMSKINDARSYKDEKVQLSDKNQQHNDSLMKSFAQTDAGKVTTKSTKASTKDVDSSTYTDDSFVPMPKGSPENLFWETERKLFEVIFDEYLKILQETGTFSLPKPKAEPLTERCVAWEVDIVLNVDDIQASDRPTTVILFILKYRITLNTAQNGRYPAVGKAQSATTQ